MSSSSVASTSNNVDVDNDVCSAPSTTSNKVGVDKDVFSAPSSSSAASKGGCASNNDNSVSEVFCSASISFQNDSVEIVAESGKHSFYLFYSSKPLKL